MKYAVLIIAALGVALTSQAQVIASHAPTAAAQASRMPQGASSNSSSLLQPMGKVVARVNGVPLMDFDLTHEVYTIFPYAQVHSGVPKSMEPEMKRGAMQMIVFDELVYQEAQRRRVTVPEARVKAAEEKFMREFKSREQYQAYLRAECKNSPQVLHNKIRRSLLIEAVIRSEVGQRAKVSEVEARKYYEEHIKSYEHPEQFEIQTVSILPPPNSSPEIQREAKRRAEEAYKAAKSTNSFAEFGKVAEKYSDDDYHFKMGDHKAVNASDLPPEVLNAAKHMQVGQVSGLIQLKEAYTIFRLNGHKTAGRASFSEVKEKLRSDMEKARFEKIRADLNQRLRKSAKIEEL